MKDILMKLDGSGFGGAVDAFAISLAAEFGAYLTAAGVVLQIIPVSSPMGEVPIDITLEIAEEARAAARKSFDRLRAEAPASMGTELVMIEDVAGLAGDRFAKLARHFDLTIIGQADPGSGDDLAMATGALFGSGRPVFLVPFIHNGPARLGKPMVAWDGGLPAARALAEALPLLKRASSVEVVTLAAKDLPSDAVPGFDITRHLARHGISSTLKKLPAGEDAGAMLLSHAADSGADYIVMGGFGHSRLREFVLGGATRTMLRSMTVPLFMAH